MCDFVVDDRCRPSSLIDFAHEGACDMVERTVMAICRATCWDQTVRMEGKCATFFLAGLLRFEIPLLLELMITDYTCIFSRLVRAPLI